MPHAINSPGRNEGWKAYEVSPVDPENGGAKTWYSKAAENGYAAAQTRLGNFYFEGKIVGEDDHVANELFQKAASQGDARALFNLAISYDNG